MNTDITSTTLTLSSVTLLKAEKPAENVSVGKNNGVGRTESAIQPSNKTENEVNKDVQALSADEVKKAAEKGNKFLQATNQSLQFTVDDSTKEIVVKIVDNDTGELVRQIPSEEMLSFIKRMQELDSKQKGAVIQDRA